VYKNRCYTAPPAGAPPNWVTPVHLLFGNAGFQPGASVFNTTPPWIAKESFAYGTCTLEATETRMITTVGVPCLLASAPHMQVVTCSAIGIHHPVLHDAPHVHTNSVAIHAYCAMCVVSTLRISIDVHVWVAVRSAMMTCPRQPSTPSPSPSPPTGVQCRLQPLQQSTWA
jgi:hypothetical protein